MANFSNKKNIPKAKPSKSATVCLDGCLVTKNKKQLACKLTTPELRKRKETVIENLKSQLVEKKELEDGFAYRFTGTDQMVYELMEFVKTERMCCDFFVFDLSISGDISKAWLKITGPKGAKDFIRTELEF